MISVTTLLHHVNNCVGKTVTTEHHYINDISNYTMSMKTLQTHKVVL